ncbi:response regulator [bacterium]|nr:response regulator [bacterium]
MQKILILTKDGQSGEAILRLFDNEQGASVKSVSDYAHALEWMKQRSFDVLIVDGGFRKEQYAALGLALWSKDPTAYALVPFRGDAPERDPAFYKVLGFHPVSFEELYATLQGHFERRAQDSSAAGAQKPFPVLVVEDLDSPRDIICVFIESLGFPDVTGCSSASEALSLLEADPNRFHCVITDLKMPQITGREFIEIVRSHGRLQHLPLIVLTAYGTLDMLVDCLRLGASGFLVKPPKKEDMLRELSRAIRIHHRRESPRLASYQEAEYIRGLIEDRKVV